MRRWYAVLDLAQEPELFALVKRAPQHDCLFSGDVPLELASASPHLVRFDDAQALQTAWAERGRGKNWGILCESDLPPDALQRHFKKFLNAKLPDGTIALFRFYDPRVFNTYIRALTPEEAAPWFDGVLQYSVEGAAGQVHNYRLRRGRLFDGDEPIS
jgi:hypothetical protein